MLASPFRRAVVRLARAFGYIPTPPDMSTRLEALKGEFRRSTYEKAFLLGLAALVYVTLAFSLGVAIGQYRRGAPSSETIVKVACFLPVLAALGFYLIRRCGVTYVFEHGHLSSLSASGKLLWREDLAGITKVQCNAVQGVIWMTLQWSDRKRKVEVYGALKDALFNRVGPSRDNVLGQTRDT